MKTYLHVMGRIFGEPLMVDPEKARAIVAGLAPRLGLAAEPTGWLLPASPQIPGSVESRKAFAVTARGVAVIGVHGTLVHEAATADPPSGFMTYGDIQTNIEDAATDPAIRAILLDIDSPGGEATTSAFELAAVIREARAIKPLWAVADELALSAGYLIASAASVLLVPKLGTVGSIGVMSLHLDTSEREAKEGDRWTAIFAGARKNDLTPHEPLNDEAEALLRKRVDQVYDDFVDAVAQGRPDLTAAAVRATEAALFRGPESVAAGLADGVAAFRDTLDRLTTRIEGPSGTVTFMKTFGSGEIEPASVPAESDPIQSRAAPAAHHPGNGKEKSMSDAETTAGTPAETAAAKPAAPSDPAPPQSGAEVVDINAARGEGYAEAAEIVELCTLAGRPDMAAQFVADKKTSAEARKLLMEAKAASAGAEVSSAIGGDGNRAASDPANSPVVAACRRLAEQAMAMRGV